MKGITICKAAEICAGAIEGTFETDAELKHIVIDSRKVQPGDLFVAYKGAATDGHLYIQKAFDLGAACAIGEYAPEHVSGPVIVVKDVQKAIEDIAAFYRRQMNIPIIGVTGSVGKTSAKEMLAAVLSKKYVTLKTEGNLNNQIGVPMTLSRISENHQAAVIEMGISGFGEMRQLAAMVRPTMAVYTLIGHAHLEFLGDLDGVLRAKGEMTEFMDKHSVVIVNGDDDKLRTWDCPCQKITFGLSDECDVRAVNINTSKTTLTECDILYGSRKLHVIIPAYGKHMIYAALEGAAAGFLLEMSDTDIIEGIADFQNVGRRAAMVNTSFLTIIDDCYNANPDSVKCGIDSLCSLPGRKVCILGDMLELGADSPEMHREIGKYAVEKQIDLVLTSGVLAKKIAEEVPCSVAYATTEALLNDLVNQVLPGDVILVKASRAMNFDAVSEKLKEMVF